MGARFDAIAWIAAGALSAACGDARRLVSGQVESRRTVVSAETSARVVAVHGAQGTALTAGTLVVELDDGSARAQLELRRANLAQAQAQAAALEAGSRPQELDEARALVDVASEALAVAQRGARPEVIEQLHASVAALDASIDLAQRTLERERQLLESGNTAEARVDEARARQDELESQRRRTQAQLAEALAGARPEDVRAKEAELRAARARLALAEEGARAEDRAAARAAVDAARAALSVAEIELSRTRIVAPCDGLLEVIDVEPGEWAAAGTPLFALARAGVLRVRTFAPQAALLDLASDDVVPIYVDGHPQDPADARVERIWDEAEFTTGNVQTPQDRMLLVFRVDLEVAPQAAPGLRPGATVLLDFAARRKP